MSAAGEGWTEPNLYFFPFPGKNANESLASHQETADLIGVCCFLMVSGVLYGAAG